MAARLNRIRHPEVERAAGRRQRAVDHVEHRGAAAQVAHMRADIGLTPMHVWRNEGFKQAWIARAACLSTRIVERTNQLAE